MVRPIDKYQKVNSDEAKKLLDPIEKQIENRFDEIRNRVYNPNTKGFDYEEILRQFYDDYLGGPFDFLLRMGILDVELKVNSVLKPRENEFDIIAIYRNAIPRLVHNRLIPYDSVAFITEVKQTLTSKYLRHDLEKLSKLDALKLNVDRFGVLRSQGWIPEIERPIRILLYYESALSLDKVWEILDNEYVKSWDIFVILKENITAGNSTFRYVGEWCRNKNYNYLLNRTHPFASLIQMICNFLPPYSINSAWLLWNLHRSIEI